MRVSLTLVTGPAAEPITLAEAKTHLRVDGTDEDAYITTLITAARGKVERDTQLQLITATWRALFDGFPPFDDEPLEILLPPVQSIVSVQYLDATGVLRTWASTDYVVDAPSGPRAREARLAPAVAKSYPETATLPGAVRVEFTAGYGTSGTSVPEELKQAMKVLLGVWYEHREAVVAGASPAAVMLAYDALIAPFQRLTAAIA